MRRPICRVNWETLIDPYGVLWFIYMLGIFGLTAKLLWQFEVPAYFVILVAAALQMAQIQAPSYLVTQFAGYFAFFYIGFVAAPLMFRLVAWTNQHVALALAMLYSAVIASASCPASYWH